MVEAKTIILIFAVMGLLFVSDLNNLGQGQEEGKKMEAIRHHLSVVAVTPAPR